PLPSPRSSTLFPSTTLFRSPAVARIGADPDPARRAFKKNLPGLGQLRCRPRLSLSVLVLHHHQRAGQEIAAPLGIEAGQGLEGRSEEHTSELQSLTNIAFRL